MTIRVFENLTPRIASTAFVDPTALVIGDVEVGADASLWPMVVARGDIQSIRIGARTNIQDGSILHVTHDGPLSPGGHALRIGDDVTVGHRVILHGCTIGDLCLIGMGSVLMDGARLEPRVILGAGSLVTPGKVLEGDYLWLGSPVRRVRPLRAEELAYLAYSSTHYVDLKTRHSSGGPHCLDLSTA
jgi:carbonic anhydrase/acetyltransferase-like protein (isoleucine patch superfamily)